MATQQRYPTGDHSQVGSWNSPSFWSLVDDVNDSDFAIGVNLDAGDARLRFSFSPFTVPDGSTITSVVVNFRASDASLGNNTIGAFIRPTSTDRNDTPINPTTSFAAYSTTWTVNPDTGSAWTVSQVNNIALFGVWSNDLQPDVNVSSVEIVVTYTEGAPPPSGHPATRRGAFPRALGREGESIF